MMVHPGITKLDKCVDSRYTLVVMAAKRARMLGKAMHAGLTDNNGEKPVSTAVEEIADGRVGYVRSEEIRRAREWEEEKIAAIQMLNENDETNTAETAADAAETEADAEAVADTAETEQAAEDTENGEEE